MGNSERSESPSSAAREKKANAPARSPRSRRWPKTSCPWLEMRRTPTSTPQTWKSCARVQRRPGVVERKGYSASRHAEDATGCFVDFGHRQEACHVRARRDAHFEPPQAGAKG